MASVRFLSIGAVAAHFGVPPWKLRRTIERGLLAEPPRVGVYRVFTATDLPHVEKALRAAGYLVGEGVTA
jgi:DNA-binding transcriptional MerR regulator